MNKMIAVASAAAMVLASSLATIGPVTAAPRYSGQQQESFVRDWCRTHPGDRSCSDFRRNGRYWDRSHYRDWYTSHRHMRGFDPGVAGIFGFVAGAMAGAAASSARNSNSHVAACEARYRSYDVRSDTYLGYDGVRHRCNL